MAEITVEAVQAKLEQVRAAESQRAKAPSASKVEALKFTQEQVQCPACGNARPVTVVWKGETRMTPPGPLLCDGCVAEREAAQRVHVLQANVLDLLAQAGVNVRQHGQCTFESFDPADAAVAMQATMEFVAEVRAAQRHDRVRGLYLAGSTGSGKTHLAVAAVRELVVSRGPDSVLFVRAGRLVTDLQDTYGSGKTGQFLDRLERVSTLVVDDIGTEKATDDSLRLLFDLINAREGHPTLMTSNYAPAELGARFRDSDGWARIASRLAQSNYRAVKVGGRDRRFDG